jgi:signal recognition particle subunit SRP54
MIPGLGQQLGDVDIDERQLRQVEAIVLSMTPRERSTPHVIDGKRRQRIARGSGTSVEQVNKLIEARKMMEKMMKGMGKGKMPALPPQLMAGDATVPGGPPRRSATKKRKNKRKARR